MLLWEPEFAVISSFGDFGVTSGPSIYKASRAENERSFYGHFASVWHKNNLGKWKVLCDIGINHDSTYNAIENVSTVVLSLDKNISSSTVDNPAETEQRFLNVLRQNGTTLPAQMLAAKALILLQEKHPVQGEELKNYNFTSAFSDVYFSNIGHLSSPAKDMFVSYGKTNAKDKEANYLSAWIYVGKAWKLFLFLVN